MSDDEPRDAWDLSKLAKGGRMTQEELDEAQYWVDADWESHDIDKDAVRLIKRLLLTQREGTRS